GSRGDQAGALPSFKSSAQQTFFSYVPGATASGERTRMSPAAFYYYKSVGAFAEYACSTQAVKSSAAAADVTNRGWEVTGSFVLTFERALFDNDPNAKRRPEHAVVIRLQFNLQPSL